LKIFLIASFAVDGKEMDKVSRPGRSH